MSRQPDNISPVAKVIFKEMAAHCSALSKCKEGDKFFAPFKTCDCSLMAEVYASKIYEAGLAKREDPKTASERPAPTSQSDNQ